MQKFQPTLQPATQNGPELAYWYNVLFFISFVDVLMQHWGTINTSYCHVGYLYNTLELSIYCVGINLVFYSFLGTSANSTSSSAVPSRRLSSVDRDNKKLMSVLAARRQEQGGKLQQLRAECDRNCTSNFTTRASAGCISQCVQLYRDESGGSSNTLSSTTSQPGGYAANQSSRNRSAHRHYDPIRTRGRGPLVTNAKDPNEIQHLDELLDTEESQSSGLYLSHPRERYATDTASGVITKDLANSTNLGTINVRSNVIENELRQTSTEKVYLKYAVSRTGPKSIPKIFTSQVESSLEEADLTSYHQFGQKLRQNTPRREQISQTVGPRKTPIQAMLINSRTTPSKTDDEDSVDSNSFKQPSKIRRLSPDGQRRNIVTLTRKFGGTIPKSALDTLVALSSKSTEAISAEMMTIFKRNNEDRPIAEKSATQINNATQVLDTSNKLENIAALTDDTLVPEEPISSTELLIHVPDPDPVAVTDNELISSSTISAIIPESNTQNTSVSTIPTTTTTSTPLTAEENIITTVRPFPSSTLLDTSAVLTSSTTTTTTPAPTTTTSTTTTTTTPTPTTSTTQKPRPTALPLPALTPPPNYHHVEEPKNLIIFNPVVPPKDVINVENSTDQPNSSSTVRPFTRTTVSSSVRSTINSRHRNKNTSSTTEASTTPFDLKILSNITSYIAKGNFSDEDFRTLAKYFPDMSTRRPAAANSEVMREDSEVTIEMHRMNMATYVLAGLGVFPIVAILLYLAKTVVFRKPPKTDTDLERYMAEDQKKISPVVKIESSSGKPQEGIYSEGSIMTEESFNRNLLKFKSLLGEGNFGQVWKAEADDLLGHMGTTRIVAVKTERCGMVNGGLQDEAAIMRKLGSHANVVTLLGACTTKGISINVNSFSCYKVIYFTICRAASFDYGICNERTSFIVASSS